MFTHTLEPLSRASKLIREDDKGVLRRPFCDKSPRRLAKPTSSTELDEAPTYAEDVICESLAMLFLLCACFSGATTTMLWIESLTESDVLESNKQNYYPPSSADEYGKETILSNNDDNNIKETQDCNNTITSQFNNRLMCSSLNLI